MLDQLPPFLAAEVLKNLDAADLCRVEQVCRFFAEVHPELLSKPPEYAAEIQMRERHADSDHLVLLKTESWKLLLLLSQCISDSYVPRRSEAPPLRAGWVFESGHGEFGIRVQEAASSLSAVVGGFRKVERKTRRQRRDDVCALALRQVMVAQRMGQAGYWTQASELLVQMLQKHESLQDRAADPGHQSSERLRFMVDVQCMISTFLVDEAYASTFVSGDGNENRNLFLAGTLAKSAVEMVGDLRERHPEDSELVPTLAHALHAMGRAYGLVGQHVGLGVMSHRYAIKLPSCEQIFLEGKEALSASIRLADQTGRLHLAARARASLAELMYCAASANTRGPRALMEPNQDLVQGVESLTRTAIANSLHALQMLKAAGEEENARIIARVMKDIGKMYNFASIFVFRLHDDSEQSRRWLQEALELQTRLDGLTHKNTRNVRRLMGLEDADDMPEENDEHEANDAQDSEPDIEPDPDELEAHADTVMSAAENARVEEGGGAQALRAAGGILRRIPALVQAVLTGRILRR